MFSLIKYIIYITFLSYLLVYSQNQPPEVTNVTFAQRTDGAHKVDIYYDLFDADGDEMTVSVEVSDNAGQTYNFTATLITGDIGEGITSGTYKHIVWDFGNEHPDYFSDKIKIKIIADDGYVANNPPTQPTNPSPVDGALEIPIDITLTWDCADPEGDPITYEIYFGTDSNPPLTVNNYLTQNYNPGTLNENTTYYWKIVANDNHGNSSSGNVWNFTTEQSGGGGEPCPGIPTVTYAGKTYNTVQIGDQCWLKENLDVGTLIESNSADDNQTDNDIIEKYCYDNDPTNCNTYGGLYQWNEAMQYNAQEGAQGICPDGWHIPTLAEFETLQASVNNDGNALKEIGQGIDEGAGTNESGFSALLTGIRSHFDGVFIYFTNSTNFWSSTNSGIDNASDLYLLFNQGNIFVDNNDKNTGFSVRCIED